ncbi:signal-induced proliferation-associated 1-like protein 3 isoform X1 [Chelonoidis abingdonii]|uniref:signal-induced proliferation-associated 1-like protein 3 isoform X1 n=1 Tax=Chelonoidis abingdonii TaxID=106734 RepID=UPI0013F1D78A|nr:signal-induced proliferation-associated 1-like protein 3 isoform X1 [Chelonoidis abingdonii]XP_032651527.1 signal-induced proliferation-associated 1-like protein 3 isoform X1 [Chelonoidis abingdonii]XP_032651528.1 signal-induced proliferation-associated 1-like protein 3 isoform X1 [Chelonoidis abingdonii]
MTSYRPIPHASVDVGGPALKGDDGLAGTGRDYFSPGFWVQNGSSLQPAGDGLPGPRPTTTTPAMPKMGVRARIADWPPKRDALKDPAAPSPSRDMEALTGSSRTFLSPKGFQNGQQPPPTSLGSSGLRGLHRLSRRRSKDVEFLEGWPRSPGRAFIPLRNRSNSEITLSECDLEETLEPRGAKLGSGLPLFREYGSTSSIDVQGISEQSLFDMLRELRAEKPAQRRLPAEKPSDLRADASTASSLHVAGSAKADMRNGLGLPPEGSPTPPKEKPRKKGPKGEAGGDSIFRKLRSSRSDGEPGRALLEQEEGGKAWVCQKTFAHYDVQSLLFDLNQVAANRVMVAQRRNTTTGASAASAVSAALSRAYGLGGLDPAFSSTEDLNYKENLEHDLGDNNSNDLLLSCPHFRNEVGGMCERNVSFSKALASSPSGATGEGGFLEPSLNTYCTNASISVLEVPRELQRSPSRLTRHNVEHVDLGARYYRLYFHGKEHSNYFGVDEKLGPVAVSIRREKLEDHKEYGPQYQYRIIFRTSELVTLRGSILEDAIPTTTKHGTVRGLPLKDVLEYVVPELNTHCLRLAMNTPKITEQLLKLDEQGLCRKHKVGILYCKAGQSSEEEMYNNEEAGPAFEEFLSLIGEKVCLKAFSKYAAQLDTKTDSTGTHSLYTVYQDYEIMFHVSTMLPYTLNNRQQLLRKRHIGNDIVTIIFQEPGALPFTPQNIRSHFQHVFIIVRVHSPCTDNVCYSVAVTRSKDAPPFGPPIPSGGVTFRKSDIFRDFLLAKVINAENAAHKSDKFHTMATRTRQEYLKDLAENCITNTPIDSMGKFNLISLTSKKKEKMKARVGAEQYSSGAIAWRVSAQDFAQGMEIECILAIANEFIVLLDLGTKEVVFNCFCGDVIGWTPDPSTLRIFYGRGDHVSIQAADSSSEDIKEIMQRLKAMTSGCETVDMTLRRNGLGQLGFHVKYDGTVAEVEDYGFAWQAGLRQGSRLVEICKVAVVTLSHDQMIDLLRTSVTVKVVIIPPHEDGVPRRGWAESFKMSSMEHKAELERVPTGHRPPYRSNSAWQWSGPASHNSSQAAKWTEPPPLSHAQSLTRPPKQTSIVPYREPQPLHSKRPVSFPETPHTAASSPAGTERGQPYRQPSGSFSTPGSGGTAYTRYKPSPERYATSQRPVLPFEQHYSPEVTSSGDSSSGGLPSQESTMERHKPEPLWHVPVQSRLPAATGSSMSKRPSRQELAGKDSPNRPSKGEAPYSSHSSSNTLSSCASSRHSDERWSDVPDPAEGEPDSICKGGSSDSGIDTALYAKPSRLGPPQALLGSAHYESGGKRREPSPAVSAGSQSQGYRPKMYAAGASAAGPATAPSRGSELFKQPSNFSLRQGRPAQGYKTPMAETPRPPRMSQSSSFQLSASVPKSFFSKQPSRNKPASGWKRAEETPTRPVAFTDPKKQIDMNTKNVFGQPRLRASLRDLRSPRKNYKSTIEDDLKKLIIMDGLGPEPERAMSPQKPLQRTLSDESLCSGRRDASYANGTCFEQSLASDVLFTSIYPSNTLPTRRQHPQPGNGALPEKKSTISASELSLSDMRDQPTRRLDPGLMPLPDTAAGLEWSSLVNAAKAYEVQRAVSLFSLNDSALSPEAPAAPSLERQPTPRTTPTMSEELPLDLTGKVCQLEAMLKQLHSDLQKEKQDKVVLQAEVASLRQNNQRLQEESQTANEQLRKFAEIFSNPVDKEL